MAILERTENILTLGIVAVVLYFIYKIYESFTTQGGAGQSAANTAYNAATGGLTQAQIQQQIQAEATQIVAASNGTISLAQATQQATVDQNAQQKSAQPSFWDGVSAAFQELVGPGSGGTAPGSNATGIQI